MRRNPLSGSHTAFQSIVGTVGGFLPAFITVVFLIGDLLLDRHSGLPPGRHSTGWAFGLA